MATPAAIDRSEASVLREQAAALRKAADRLAEQRMEIMREAWSMESEADNLEREWVSAPSTPAITSTVEHDTSLMTRVSELLASRDTDMGSSDIAECLGITQTRARSVLGRLQAIGMVTRVGVKSATRYRLTTETEVPTPEATTDAKVHEFGNYRTAVRDAAIGLGTFDIDALLEALPDMAEGTVRRWLKAMTDDGLFEVERIDRRNVYAYRKPGGATPARPRRATPEAEAVKADATRGHAVAGAGRARVGSPIVDALIREVAPYGVTVTTSKHRVEYRLDGRIVATSSKTPGASSLKATRGELRRAGVPV